MIENESFGDISQDSGFGSSDCDSCVLPPAGGDIPGTGCH